MGRGGAEEIVDQRIRSKESWKEESPLFDTLPLDVDLYPKDLQKDVLGAVFDVIEMEPLDPGEERPSYDFGNEPLPDDAPRLIGISGRSRAGKDSIAEGIFTHYANVRHMNFSDMIIDEVNDWLQDSGHVITEGNKSDPRYRHLLQAWGVARRAESASYWTDSVKEKVKDYWNDGVGLVIVCGVRALSDLAAIEDLGGEHWRVVRPDNEYQAEHAIERQLDDLPPERQTAVINDADLGALYQKVYRLLGD